MLPAISLSTVFSPWRTPPTHQQQPTQKQQQQHSVSSSSLRISSTHSYSTPTPFASIYTTTTLHTFTTQPTGCLMSWARLGGERTHECTDNNTRTKAFDTDIWGAGGGVVNLIESKQASTVDEQMHCSRTRHCSLSST